MPPLPSAASSFAICLRCQFRYSHRLSLPRRTLPPPPAIRFRPAALFSTTLISKAASSPPPRELVILEPPGPLKSRHKYGPAQPDLDAPNLDTGIQQLLTFECREENFVDATHMEISLYKPYQMRVSRERYNQIAKDINRAFLKDQLHEYYLRSIQLKPRANPLGRTPTKPKILNEIMRNLWKIEVTDEIAEREDVLRDKEIKSSRRNIFFMIGEDGRVLRQWAQKYSTRIVVNVQTSVLQLRGSLANIERIEAEIKNMLDKIITEDIDLSWVSRLETFNEEFITPIARITNTFIEKIDENIIRVVALGPERNAIEDARRLLFTSLDLQLRTSYSLLYNAPHSQESTAGALYPFSEDLSLPWRFRGRDWARWRDVKRRINDVPAVESEPPSQEAANTIKTRDERRLGGLEEIRKVLDESTGLELGDRRLPPAEYQVILGCLLHDSDGHNMSAGPQALEEFIKEERPRVLAHDFPGAPFIAQMPSHLARPLGNSAGYSYVLKFAPSPWSNPNTFENFPPLELNLKVDPYSGEVRNPKLVAVHSESMADFLMPSRACDLRFLSRVDVPLDLGVTEPAAGGVTKEELARFMRESNLNLTSNNKLRASSQIKVAIPPWVMQQSKPPSMEEGEVDYIFTGMEFRRELQFDFRGFCLHYTVVEGGISGGRKTVVKLICKGAGEGLKDIEETTREVEELEADREGGEIESRIPEPEIVDSGSSEVQELERHEPQIELETPEGVSNKSFSSFVNTAMRLVDSLEKALSYRLKPPKGVLRS